MNIQDKNTNDLKDLLRSKLAVTEPAEDGWNVPSVKVWEGISEEVKADAAANKHTDRHYLLLSIIVGLLSMLLFRECSSNDEINGLKLEMDTLRNSYEQLQEDCGQKQTKVDQQENSELGIPENSILAAANTAAENNPVFPINAFHTSFDKEPSTPLQFFSKNRISNLFQTILAAQATPNLGSETGVPTEIVDRKNLSKLPLLSEIKLFQTPRSLVQPVLFANPVLTPEPKSIPLLPSIFIGTALTGNELKGDTPAIIKDQRAMVSYRMGFGMEAIFNRHWSVETGVQYAVHRTQTDYQLEVPYTQNNEFLHDDGNYDNLYSHSLPSTMGNYPALLTLSRESGASVDEQEIMPLDLTIEQQLRFVSVPLRLRYGFGKAPFRLGVKGGIVANRSFDISSKSVGLVSHHSAIHQRHTSVGNPIFDELQKTTFDYSIGLDARLSLSKKLQAFMEISHQRGLTPIYEEENFKNFLRSDALLLGLIYAF